MKTENEKQREEKAKKVMPVSPGRPKGIPNKVTTEVKQMVLEALAGLGGVDYLVERGKENPAAFLTLLGKVIPLQVNGAGEDGSHKVVHEIRLVALDEVG